MLFCLVKAINRKVTTNCHFTVTTCIILVNFTKNNKPTYLQTKDKALDLTPQSQGLNNLSPSLSLHQNFQCPSLTLVLQLYA